MARGGLSHLALTASDLARSIEFYDKVLGFMGYERGEVPESTQQAMKTQLVAWGSPNGAVTLRPAKSTPTVAHDRNQPGLNHVAFNAEDRADVEKLHTILKKMGAQILDPPAEYLYFPGYYAVYFTDPDGIKIEFVFYPQS
jgi:catechol 2,3-dioxygenase-like lactoylglutathione lyase family enzyme